MRKQIEEQLDALRGMPLDPQLLRTLAESMERSGDVAPDFCEALARERDQLAAQERWEAVIALIDLELQGCGDGARRSDLLEAKGRVLEDELLDEEQAIAAYEQALEFRRGDDRLSEVLQHIKMVRENWRLVAERYVEEADAATDTQLATSMLLKAAEVIARNDARSALVETYLRRSLELEPRNRKASAHLERLYRNEGRLDELAGLLARRASAAVSREDRLAALGSLGSLWAERAAGAEELARDEALAKAIECYRRVLAIDATEEHALRFLGEELRRREDWSALARLYEDALRTLPEGPRSVDLIGALAALYGGPLNQPGEAQECFRRLRRSAPAHPAMLDFYRRHYAEKADSAKLLPLLDAAQKAEVEPATRRSLLREMAQIAERDAGNLEKAIDMWKAVLRMDQAQVGGAADPEAIGALKRLYRRTTPPKWNALRELIKEQLDALPPGEVDAKVALLLETIEIYRDHLKLDVMVANTYNLILALKPDHQESIEALARHYENLGRWADLIDVLLRREQIAEDREEKIALLRRVAAIWLEKGNQSRAIEPLERILAIDPLDESARTQLEEIQGKRRNWRAVFELQRGRVEQLRGAEELAQLKQMAGLAAGRLGDLNEALRLWKAVLEQAPGDVDALNALATLYTRLESWEDLAHVLAALQRDERDPKRRLERQEALAELWGTKLGNPGKAIESWLEVLELRPDHPKALALLKELLVREQRWDDLEAMLVARGDLSELADALTTAADRSRDAAAKVKLYKRVGELCVQGLNSPDRAIKSFERVLAVDPQNLEALWALAPLYRATERWSRLLSTYEALVSRVEERAERLRLLAEIRRLCETHLGSRHLAFQWCARAYELTDGDEELARELERLAGAAGAWDDLVEVYRRRAAEVDEAKRNGMLARVAQICEQQLQRPERAAEAYREQLRINPDDATALTALAETCERMQAWSELAEIRGRQADLAGGGSARRTELLLQRAMLQEERLGDVVAAAATYECIASEGEEARALQALERLYSVLADWPALVAVLERQLAGKAGGEGRVELLLRQAEVFASKLEAHGRALDAIAEALVFAPSHDRAKRLLERYLDQDGPERARAAALLRPIYELLDDAQRLAQVLEVLLEHGTDSLEEEIDLLSLLAALYDSRLDQPKRALEIATRWLQLEPNNVRVTQLVVSLAERADALEQAVESLGGALEQAVEDGAQLAIHWELACLLDDHLGRTLAAEEHLRRVVQLDPEREEAWRRLERLLRDNGRWVQLRDVLRERLALVASAEQKREILFQIAALSEDVLEDADAAIATYEQMATLQGDDAEAARALERLYRQTERWEALAELYQQQLAFSPSAEERHDLLVRQAQVRAQQLKGGEAAVELLAEVLQANPHHGQAAGLLRSLFAQQPRHGRMFELLERVYLERRAWGDLAQLLQMRLDGVSDPAERRALCERLAELYQQLGDRAAAFARLADALAIAPGDEALAERFDRLLRELECWRDGIAAWEVALGQVEVSNVPVRNAILVRIGELAQEGLGEADRAAEAYESALAAGPVDLDQARLITERLGGIYRSSRRWTDLVRVLRARLPWVVESAETGQILGEIGRIQEELLEQPDQATNSYRALLAEAPGSVEALDALERLYLRQERWADLVGILDCRVHAEVDAETRRQLRRRIAELQESALDDLERTLAAHQAILQEFPADVESVRAAARILRAQGRWPELLLLLERQHALSQAGSEERVDVLYQLAEIQDIHLADRPAAVARYREVLDQRPQHAQARQALETLLAQEEHCLLAAGVLAPLYRAERNWHALVRVAEAQLGHLPRPDQLELLCTIAEIQQHELGELQGAFDAQRRAMLVADGPKVLDRLGALEELAGQLDRWGAVLEAIEAVLAEGRLGEDEELVLSLRAAEISWRSLAEQKRAIKHYQRVLVLEPDSLVALAALRQLLEEQQEWLPLLGVLLRWAELAEEPHEQVSLLFAAALVCRDKLERVDDAIEQLQRVLEIQPDHEEAAALLDALCERAQRWGDLARLLEHRAGLVEDSSARVLLHERLATLRSTRLGRHDLAIQSYQRLLRDDPKHSGARAALEAYLGDPRLREQVLRVLEPLYVAQQEWEKVVSLYAFRLDLAEHAAQRRALTMRIAQLCEEQLEDLPRALDWYGRVFCEDPSDVHSRDQVLRLGGVLDRWEIVAQLCEEALAVAPAEGEGVRELLLILGRIYGDRLYRWQPAKACFERVLERRPGDADAFEALQQLLERYERWNELLSCYERASERAVEARERRGLLQKAARVWEERLEDLAQAIDVYRAMLAEADDDPEVIAALDRLYHQSGRWEDLAELLSRQLGSAKDQQQQVSIKFRLGQTYELRLKDVPAAIDYYEEVLRQEPSHVDAVAALERLVVDRGQRFRITQILEPIYRARDEWAKLVVVYEAELDFVDDAERRAHLLREIARLYEQRGGMLDSALKALCRAFIDEQRREVSEELLGQIERLAEPLQAWAEVAQLIRRAVDRVYDYEYRNVLLARLARLCETRLSDPSAAIATWRRVLAAKEYDEEAIEELIRLLDQLAMHGQLIEVLQRRAELAVDPKVKVEAYRRIAQLSRRELGQEAAAAEAWRQLLGIDEYDLEALDELGGLLASGQKYQDLAWVLQQKIALAEHDEGRWRALQLELAGLYEQQLGGTFEAISVFKALLERLPGDAQAYEGLDRLYTSEGLWSDLLEIVELREDNEQDPVRANELVYRAGTLLMEHIGDLDAALDRFEQVLALNSSHEGARRALERLLTDPDRRERVAQTLQRLYERVGDDAALVRVLLEGFDALDEPGERRNVLVRVAELEETKLGDAAKAFEHYARALGEDPANEAVQAHLARLAGQLGRWPETLALYERCLEGLGEPGARRSLHLKLAGLYESPVGNDALDLAEQHLRAAIDLEGDENEALQSLERLLERQLQQERPGKLTELLDVLERRQLLVVEPAEQALLSWRMGEIHSALGNREAAFAAYRDGLERDASHARCRQAVMSYLSDEAFRRAALDALEPVYEADGDHEALIRLGELRLASLASPGERIAVLERMARRQEDELELPERALETMGRALHEDPTSGDVLEQLGRLAQLTGLYRRATEIVEELLSGVEPGGMEERVLSLQLAEWYYEKLGESARAERRYRLLLDHQPACLDALEALEAICIENGDLEGIASVLERRASLTSDSSRRAALWGRVAQLRAERLAQPARAIEAWKEVLKAAPESGEALVSLASLYGETQNWTELVLILREQAERSASRDEQRDLRRRIGEVLRDGLGDADQAADAFRGVLELDPADEAAWRALEQIERERGRWASLREVLVHRLDRARGADRLALFREIARVSGDCLGDDVEAAAYYQQILLEAPRDPGAYEQLERLYRQHGRWHELLDLLRRQVTLLLADSGDERAAVTRLVGMAQIWSEQLGDRHAAIELIEEALAKSPGDLRAITELARLRELTGELEEALLALARADGQRGSAEQVAEIEFRRGSIRLKQGFDLEQARACFDKAIAVDPKHEGALRAREALARERGDWKLVAATLELRCAAAEPAARLPLLAELGELYGNRLGQADASVLAWERALTLRDDDADIAFRLAEAYTAAGRLAEAESLVRQLTEQGSARRSKIVADYEHLLGVIAQRRGEDDAAVAHFESAQKADSTRGPTLVALGALYVKQEKWESARRVYRSMLLQAPQADWGITRAQIFCAIGRIYKAQGDLAKARSMFERGLEAEPDNLTLKHELLDFSGTGPRPESRL